MNICIVLPTYNESKNITSLIREIDNVLKKNYNIIIVDDNSPDGTGNIAEELSKKYPINVLHRKGKLGLGSAVIDGFGVADGNIIGVMDADLSHPVDAIPKLIKPIVNGRADITIGSRYVKGGGAEFWPFSRKFISKSAISLAFLLTKVKDPMSGFFFLKPEVIKGIRLKTKGYKILLEILVKGKYDKFEEVPYVFKNRALGKSKLNYKEYFSYVKGLVSLYFYKLKSIFK